MRVRSSPPPRSSAGCPNGTNSPRQPDQLLPPRRPVRDNGMALDDLMRTRHQDGPSPEREERHVVQAVILGAGHVGREDLDDEHLGEELDLGRQQVAHVGGG